MTVAVVGLGHAGLPLATVIADAGFKVIGIDKDNKRCLDINNGINPIKDEPYLDTLIKKHHQKNIFATTNYRKAKDCNVFIVLIPVLLNKNGEVDLSNLKDAISNIGEYCLKKNDCVIIESTVPPLTTENEVKKWLEEKSGLNFKSFYLAHSPERIMTGYSVSRLLNFPKIIGGVDNRSGLMAFDIYKNFIPNIQWVSSSRIAEFIKVIEGCYRFVNIALANELYKIADELEVDFSEAKEFANHEFCNIHNPSTGVGGHCIPVYPRFLINLMENKKRNTVLLQASYVVNDEMVYYFADEIVHRCLKIKKPMEKVKICIKGISFREGVKSIYNSTNFKLALYLKEHGWNIYVYDELYTKKEINQMGLSFLNPKDADIVFDAFKLVII